MMNKNFKTKALYIYIYFVLKVKVPSFIDLLFWVLLCVELTTVLPKKTQT